MIDETKCWEALLNKNLEEKIEFFYGVITTKIFCRVGCPSRLPLRANVRFYRTTAEAQAAGFRPCLRCQTVRPEAETVPHYLAQVRKYVLTNLENRQLLKLEALSRHFHQSPFHFQRTFKAIVGITPRQYVEELRMQMFKEDLRSGTSVTNAVYDAGFSSSSRVYERVNARLGMTPKQYQSGGKEVQISYSTMSTPLGLILIGATDRGICFLEFGNSHSDLQVSLKHEYPLAQLTAQNPPYSDQYMEWMKALSAFLQGEKVLGKLPICLNGTAFQMKVWNYLQSIPSGKVQTYTEVAKAIGQPRAARAVAGACAANRIAVVVPCHRVIRGDGGMGGYRWGLGRKRALIDMERRVP